MGALPVSVSPLWFSILPSAPRVAFLSYNLGVYGPLLPLGLSHLGAGLFYFFLKLRMYVLPATNFASPSLLYFICFLFWGIWTLGDLDSASFSCY